MGNLQSPRAAGVMGQEQRKQPNGRDSRVVGTVVGTAEWWGIWKETEESEKVEGPESFRRLPA